MSSQVTVFLPEAPLDVLENTALWDVLPAFPDPCINGKTMFWMALSWMPTSAHRTGGKKESHRENPGIARSPPASNQTVFEAGLRLIGVALKDALEADWT